MNITLTRNTFFCFLLFCVASCITINIYFPAAAVEKAADRIVDEVWGPQGGTPGGEDEKKQDVQPQSRMGDVLIFALSLAGPREAMAQEADINVTTPAIRALKESIQSRAESIRPYMDGGNIGISREGLLVVRTTEGLNLKDKAAVNRLVEAENHDRNSLYEEIARANNFPPERVADIKTIFAGSWAKNARAGWWVQDDGGSWKQK
ncbi:MAG: hypothetical protein AMK71_08790 [Nitrospira bacterium SG8_35_4]|nr:MAG: hypothetical protein AMK71_08790 [Nitrospira bacterium SG8_35_4]